MPLARDEVRESGIADEAERGGNGLTIEMTDGVNVVKRTLA
jgi:hypothetical protein